MALFLYKSCNTLVNNGIILIRIEKKLQLRAGRKMLMVLAYIYIIFIIGTMFLVVKDRKNSNKNHNINKRVVANSRDKKIALIIVSFTMLIYKIIGYIFKTDIFNFITYRKNGFSVSFIGLVLLFFTSIVIGNIIDILGKVEKGKS